MIKIAALFLSALFCFSSAGAQEAKKIKIGYPAISYNQIHIWVAKDAGLFRKYGLDAEIVFFRGGQMATQALVAGDPPIVNIGTVVQAGLQGHDIVLIASSENAYNYSVVARAGINKIEELKGKRLGMSGFGSASHNAALILFKKFNLEPNKDVSLVVAGPTSDRLSAVEGGRIDATLLTPSELPRARKQGLVEVYDMLDLGHRSSRQRIGDCAVVYQKPAGNRFKRAKELRRGHLLHSPQSRRDAQNRRQIFALVRSGSARRDLYRFCQKRGQKALSDAQRHSILARRGRGQNA